MEDFFEHQEAVVRQHRKRRNEAIWFFIRFSLVQSIRLLILTTGISIIYSFINGDWAIFQYAFPAVGGIIIAGPILGYRKIMNS
jgi:hypothetical protein